MRAPLPFHFVDVFAVEPLTGNPLAVVDGGADLTEGILKRIAREFNQSETTFVLPPTRPDADWRLRSFTAAGAEVFGAGHNSLGAWWWLAHSGKLALDGTETVFHQEIGTSVLAVTISQEKGRPTNIIMDQEAPVAGRKLEDLAALTTSLGLTIRDLRVDRVPCQVVSTGAAHLMVPVRDRETVDRIVPDPKLLYAVLNSLEAEGCYTFSLDPLQPGAFAYARFFNPTVGIWEDPATGTAAGPLAAHLVANGLAESGQAIIVEQGTAMGRTSLIKAQVQATAIRISGAGVVVASGYLHL